MPQMGESIFEGTITKWLKNEGEQVARDEPLFEISTDKVDAEIPAPASGVLTQIKAEAGTTVPVNTVVAVIGDCCFHGERGRCTSCCGQRRSAARATGSAREPEATPGEEVRTSPLVRKLASEHNVDLRRVAGQRNWRPGHQG